MSDKGKNGFREEKNAALKAADPEDTNSYESSEKGTDPDGNISRGSPGHWRFRKDSARVHRSGTTGMHDFGTKKIPEAPNPKAEEPKATYSYDELKAMNRTAQVRIIQKYSGKDAEIPRYETGKNGRIALIQKLQK